MKLQIERPYVEAMIVEFPQLIDQLVETFPAASGRDIKGLSKLAAKYCQHKKLAPTLDVFQRCSVFRGMEFSQQ